MQVLVTGAAGFIGFHACLTLLRLGASVLGVDNLDPYYSVALKEHRLNVLRAYGRFKFLRCDVTDAVPLTKEWRAFDPSHVLHLAAQAGVRHSIENPMAYIRSNVTGFQSVIELVRAGRPKAFVYASSSSVYGENSPPFSEADHVGTPKSLYAVTKIANEMVARTYHDMFQLPATGLRFFTVYGPYGRPDMAMYKFARAILQGEAIDVYGHGGMSRDFTYVTDIVDGIISALRAPRPGRVYNLGSGRSVPLPYMIKRLEDALDRTAVRNSCPMQPGDVEDTLADISAARTELRYIPRVPIEIGISRFAEWFKDLGYRF